MKLEVLRYFLQVDQEGSIRKASERVNITPSALSRHITLLEHMVGAPLFERRSRGMTLTCEGQILKKYALRTVNNVDFVKSAVDEIRGLRNGVVRVAAIEILASSLIFPAVRNFQALHPGANFEVEIITRENDDAVHALFRDQVDIGIMYKFNPIAELDYFAEFETPFAVIASPSHPLASRTQIATTDLVGVSIATLGQHSATRRILERSLASAGIELDYRLQVNCIEMAKQFAQTGVGVTVLPSIAARVECAKGTLVAIPLTDWSLRRVSVGLCAHKGHSMSTMAASFLDLLKQQYIAH